MILLSCPESVETVDAKQVLMCDPEGEGANGNRLTISLNKEISQRRHVESYHDIRRKKAVLPNISPAYVVAQLTSFAKLESGISYRISCMGGIAPGPKPILRCRALMQTLEPSEEASH